MESLFRWDPGWRVDEQGQDIVLTAGADLAFSLGDPSPPERDALTRWAKADPIERPPAGAESELFEQLVSVGTLSPVVANAPPSLGLHWLGTPAEQLAGELRRQAPRASRWDEAPEVRIVIRTTASWNTVLRELTAVAAAPYLFVDLAYHHTFTVGPLAIPAETACAGCLAGRITQRWGDLPIPSAPAVMEEAAFIAAVVTSAVRRLRGGALPYVNATSTWDLGNAVARREPLYRVPGCPHCDANPKPGHLRLPWE